MGKVIISLSAGTAFLAMLLGGSLCVAIIAAGYCASGSPPPSSQMYAPSPGIKGAIERLENDLKYGKVNMEAANEVKNGLPLFDRIRANRQARCQPATSARVVDGSDCNYSDVVSNPVPNQSIVVQTTGIEYPSTKAPTAAPVSECKDGKCKPLKPLKATKVEALKTGAFICSNCRKPKIADWHTDWKEDGTPITFLCERCHSLMSPEQRENAYKGYIARQSKSAGVSGLLHQEIGQ